MVCFNLLYALCFSTEATTKNTGNSEVISKSKKTVSSQTTHPIMDTPGQPCQRCTRLLLLSWEVDIWYYGFCPKKHPQIPQIQHSMCKVVNQMEKTYIFIPIYLSKAGKSFMIDSWSFVKRFTSASVEVPPKKALRWRWCLWNARIARNNYGSVPISSGGELLPYLCLKGGRHCFDAMY